MAADFRKEGSVWESKNLVICDPEEGYANALALYLMHRKELSLQVQVCSGLDHVQEVAGHTRIDFLFLPESISPKEREQVTAAQVFILTGAPDLTPGGAAGDVPRVYKYQSGEKILGEMLRCCQDLQEEGALFRKPGGKKEAEVIGIFSPVHRIGKTTYALKLGEELSRSANVLYLNLELCGGIGDTFEEGTETLADVLYYAGQEKGNLGMALTMTVKHRGGLDYVLPDPVSEDLKSVPTALWVDLIRKVLSESIYETLILDIDEGIPGVYDLLRACTKLIVLTEETAYAQAKIRQLEQELKTLGYEDVWKKISWKEGKYAGSRTAPCPDPGRNGSVPGGGG